MQDTQSHLKSQPSDPTSTSHLTRMDDNDFVKEDGVLIIEDNPEIASELYDALNYFGLDAYVAHNAKTALGIVGEFPISYVLLDYRLPDINGLEVAKEISSLSPQSKVVMITGDADFYEKATLANTGSLTVLKKPISPSSIARFICNRILNKN